ncbi:MAG: CHC2 zinc finger domain-containing protein [Candidatus Eisenbacteria bacterium]
MGRGIQDPATPDWDSNEDDLLPARTPSLPYPAAEDLIRIFFPSNLEAQHLLDDKIAEWLGVVRESRRGIKDALNEIRQIEDEWSRWFCTEVLKISPAARQLKEALGQVARLKRLKRVAARIFGVEDHDGLDLDYDERVARARQVPILDVMSGVLETKKAGKHYVARCPFHSDKHPSLVIYPDKNRFRCYGCQKSGDSIEFIRLRFGYNFKQAIAYLAQGGRDSERQGV